MTLTTEVKITDQNLKDAIAIRCSPCFGALNVANALGGSETTEWALIRTFSAVAIVKEIEARGIDITALPCAVEKDTLVVDSQTYQKAKAILFLKAKEVV